MHTFLVVDDDAIIRRVLRTVLEKNEDRVLEAANGVEALAILRDFAVNLILSDLLMPEMDGYTLGYECRRNSQFRNIPIVFMTGVYDSAESKELASQLGATSYIAKPVDLDSLPTILTEALTRQAAPSDKDSILNAPDDGDYFRHYNQVLVHVLEQKMHDLERANQALRASEARYRRLAEHAQDIIYRLRIRPTFAIEFISMAIADITGYAPQEFYDDPDLLHRLTLAEDLSLTDAADADHAPFGRTLTTRLKHRSGDIVWIAHRTVPVYEDGELVAVEGIARDVTEYKQREEELQRTVMRLTVATQAAGIGIWEYDLRTGRGQWDERVSTLTGNDSRLHDAGFAAWGRQIIQDDIPIFEAVKAAIQRGEPSIHAQLRIMPTDGQLHHLEIHSQVQHAPNGDPLRLVGVVRDVTQEAESQRQLRLLSTALEAAANGVAITDHTGRLEWVNPAFTALTGYTLGECLGRNPRDLIRSGRQSQVFYRDLWETILAGHVWRGELINRRKDGSFYTEEQTITPVVDTNGALTHFIAIKQDITARGKVEAALRESESRYRSLFENSYSVMLLIDPESGSVIDANPAAAQYYGWSRIELRQMRITDINTMPRAELHAEMNLARLEQRNHFFFRHRRADGSVRDVEVYSGPIQHQGKSLLYSIVHDITERKQAEAALRKSEASYAQAQRLTRLGSWSYDFASDCSTWSEEMYHLFACDPHLPSPPMAAFLELLHPEDRARVDMVTGRTATTGESAVLEYRSNPVHGAVSYFSANVEPALDATGRITGMYGTVLDITAHRQHERELEAVASVSAALRTAATRSEMVPAVLEEMLALFAADGAAFDHVDPISGATTIELGVGAFSPCTGMLLPAGAGVSSQIRTTGTPYHTNDVASEPTALFPELLSAMRSLAGVPLIADDRITGVLWLTSRYELSGHDMQILAAIADITANAIRRAALYGHTQVQAEEMAQIMRSVPEGVLLLDAEGRIRTANARAEHYLQISSNAKVGDVLTHLGDKSLKDVLTFRSTGRQCTYRNANRTFEVVSQAVDAAPTPSGWVVVIRDVTDELGAQEQFQRQERLAAIGQLAAGIAHDFNNIMSVIAVYAQLTAESPALSARERERVSAIETQAQRAAEMIRQILDFSRRAVFERVTVDLLPLAKEQVKLLRRTLPENIRIDFRHGDGPYFVKADPTRIAQVIMNLTINARDAMPEGGSLSITLTKADISPSAPDAHPGLAAGAWVRLAVADTGVGIPDEVIDHIFEPFFTTKAPGHGTGLGLAQVHGIVGQHGGQVMVTTKAGAGATFDIYLPALAVVTAGKQVAATPGRTPQGHGETILVVEDDDQLRPTLAELLTLWNYHVLQASHGEDALNQLIAGAEKIDLVLSDVVMPVIGGIGLLKQMRQRELQTPVVMLTGHVMPDTMEALGMYGLSGWLAKPVDTIQLAETIAAALTKSLGS